MAFFSEGSAMLFVMRIEVGSCSGTAFGQVSEFMNVNAMVLVGVEPLN